MVILEKNMKLLLFHDFDYFICGAFCYLIFIFFPEGDDASDDLLNLNLAT